MNHQKEKKKDAWRSVLFLGAIILIFSVADLFNEERLYSESERRMLAQKPAFSPEILFSGEYTGDYEEYLNDQFVSRDIWVRLKTSVDMLLQKKEINGVYLGKDDYLIEQHLQEEFPEQTVEKRVRLLQELAKEFPSTEVMLVPTADNILTDKLPSFAPYYDQSILLDRVAEAIGEERMIQVYDTLKEHAEEEIYYRTDHHWTTLGAYYAYGEWAKKKVGYPIGYDPEKLISVTDEFTGTLQAKLNMGVKGEAIRIFPQTTQRAVDITYDYTKKAESFYEESYLETQNMYGYFLDDNHGLVEIETPNYLGRELFVIKDSYANTFIPLIANHYTKVYVLDLRYFNGSLFDFIRQYDNGNLEILVLYNCAHFVSDFQYY